MAKEMVRAKKVRLGRVGGKYDSSYVLEEISNHKLVSKEYVERINNNTFQNGVAYVEIEDPVVQEAIEVVEEKPKPKRAGRPKKEETKED